MPDRLALAEAVGRAVEPLGLKRLPPIQRRTVRGTKPDVPFTGTGTMTSPRAGQRWFVLCEA